MKVIVESHIPHICGLIEPFAQVEYLGPAEFTPAAVHDADALVVRTRTRCDAALLDGSRVRFIGSATIGTDHIDLGWCAAHGIAVCNAPGCNAPAVAQWVMCAINAWMRRRGIASAEGLSLGIIGVGHIGSIVARWGRQLGFDVLLNDPPREQREGGEFLPLHELQQRCDIITVHTPITQSGPWPTWHLIDREFLNSLDHCGLIINAARGAIADNSALLDWHGDIAIDCWENEPRISHRLLEKALVATPHIAGYSAQGKQRGTAMMLAALNNHFGWTIPVPDITAPATGAATVTLNGIADSYNILGDTAALKAAPDDFEPLRNGYALRNEFHE